MFKPGAATRPLPVIDEPDFANSPIQNATSDDVTPPMPLAPDAARAVLDELIDALETVSVAGGGLGSQ